MSEKLIAAGKYTLHGDQHDLVVHRDPYGKFYIRIDGVVVHKRLTASEIVKWLVQCASGEFK